MIKTSFIIAILVLIGSLSKEGIIYASYYSLCSVWVMDMFLVGGQMYFYDLIKLRDKDNERLNFYFKFCSLGIIVSIIYVWLLYFLDFP